MDKPEENEDLPQDYNALTQVQRRKVRERYIALQEGNCAHCKSPITEEPPKEIQAKEINWRLFPTGFLKNPAHLHHDHNTGMTIGAVHALCNAVLWQYHGE